MVEPPESPAFGKEAAEILEVPGPLCEEVPSGHGPHCSAPGSAAPPGLGTATESRGPCGPELLFMLPYSDWPAMASLTPDRQYIPAPTAL